MSMPRDDTILMLFARLGRFFTGAFSNKAHLQTSLCVCSNAKVKIKISHSLIAVGAVRVRVPLYLGHS